MKIHPINHLSLIGLVAALVAGCASAPSHFYTLNSTAKGEGAPAAPYAVVVGPVSVPALVDRPQFTVNVAANRVEIDEFNRWAGPLKDNIASVITGDLSVLLGTSQVSTSPLGNPDSTYRVTIDIRRFETMRGPAAGNAALVEANWAVRRPAGGPVRAGHTLARESAPGDGFDALAAAHSRALAKVSADIAAAIQAEADGKH